MQTNQIAKVTDITQFTIPSGKVYLSAIVDCFDGMAVSWALGNRPDANLANNILKIASTKLHNEHPILHSDRGAYYRWPKWIELTKKFGIDRSMSKKNCSPDNSACEGFFGRLKNECFYDRVFQGFSIKEFMKYIDEYIVWYNKKRIKITLGGLSPFEYRQLNGYAS